MTETANELLAKIENLIGDVAKLKVKEINYAHRGLNRPTPRSVILYREVLTWRVEELARSAVSVFQSDDIIGSLCLMRTVTEAAAACWYLNSKIEQHINELGDAKVFHDVVLQMLVGSKAWDDVPQAINVLTFIKHAEKEFPGILVGYNLLSEFAHPNWAGTSALFSKRNSENTATLFGHYMRSTGEREHGLNALTGSLQVFVTSHKRIEKNLADFVAACELTDEDYRLTSSLGESDKQP